MDLRVLDLAVRVINRSDAEHPADAVLRAHLKEMTGLNRDSGREVAEAVFAYFRWKGWLKESASSAEGVKSHEIKQSLKMDETFQREPTHLPNAELLAKAIPAWVLDAMEVSPAWVRVLQEKPHLWMRAKAGHSEAIQQSFRHCLPQPGVPNALEYAGQVDLFRSPEFHAGLFELQDLSSQMVGWLCAPQPGQTWWDACAGEGGKTLHLSDLMQNKGMIWSTDRAVWRLDKLKRRTARAKVFNYRTAPWDGGAKLPTKTKFDGVLVDAPCSGIGTWQRNPQARWTTTLNDVQELAQVQKQLLANVAPSIKPGGKLVYSVCTLSRAETTEVADAFSAQFPEFEPLPVASGLSAEPSARHWFWPQDHGGNGMFVALWRRR